MVQKALKSQAYDKLSIKVTRFQNEARVHFFDRMMYEINDSLTSILAITEVEPKDAIPRIKKYIHKINQSLHNTKSDHVSMAGEKNFNLNNTLKNILQVIGDNFSKARIISEIAEINAPVRGGQYPFERILLAVLTDLLNRSQEDADICLEARQKGQDAEVIIMKDKISLSEEAHELIQKTIDNDADYKGRVQIVSDNDNLEVTIRLPLQFTTVHLGPTIERAKKTEEAPIVK